MTPRHGCCSAHTGIVAASTDSLYPDVLKCMGFKQSDGRAVVLHKGTGVALKGR